LLGILRQVDQAQRLTAQVGGGESVFLFRKLFPNKSTTKHFDENPVPTLTHTSDKGWGPFGATFKDRPHLGGD
jgi:hypothetical protein